MLSRVRSLIYFALSDTLLDIFLFVCIRTCAQTEQTKHNATNYCGVVGYMTYLFVDLSDIYW